MAEAKPKSSIASLVSRPLLAGMVAAGAAAPTAAPAADDLFLNITGVKGESTDSKHKGEIVLLSYSQSFTNSGVIGGSAGEANCGSVKVTKVLDQSSPDLILGVVSGKHYDKAVITFRKAGEQPLEYYKVTLTEVLLNAIKQTDASPTDSTTVLEQLTMSAARFQFEYTSQTPSGGVGAVVRFAWDCVANKKF